MWGLGSWGLSLGLGLGLRLGFLPPEEVEVLSKVSGALARHLARVKGLGLGLGLGLRLGLAVAKCAAF